MNFEMQKSAKFARASALNPKIVLIAWISLFFRNLEAKMHKDHLENASDFLHLGADEIWEMRWFFIRIGISENAAVFFRAEGLPREGPMVCAGLNRPNCAGSVTSRSPFYFPKNSEWSVSFVKMINATSLFAN